MYTLTHEGTKYIWSDECEAAFTCLNTALTEAPALVYPHFGHEFILETDASGLGLGTELSQKQDDGTVRPIAFASRTLQGHEKKYGKSELEALGFVWPSATSAIIFMAIVELCSPIIKLLRVY